MENGRRAIHRHSNWADRIDGRKLGNPPFKSSGEKRGGNWFGGKAEPEWNADGGASSISAPLLIEISPLVQLPANLREQVGKLVVVAGRLATDDVIIGIDEVRANAIAIENFASLELLSNLRRLN